MRVPINSPVIGQEEMDAVMNVLESGTLTSAARLGGPAVRGLEEAACRFTGSRYAVAVNSGTAALQCALHALGVGPGKQVLVPSFTFVATANAVVAAGATPVFVDVLREDMTMSPDDLLAKITPESAAVIPVHLYGRMAHMDRIREIASGNGLHVIEDAAQALGSTLDGRQAGTIADAGCYSMYPGKIITAGEGGIVVTDDEVTRDSLLMVRNHGMVDGYDTRVFGLNFRMTEIAAAMGRVQFGRLAGFIRERAKNAGLFGERLKGGRIRIPVPRGGEEPNWGLYTVTMDGRDAALGALKGAGIGAAVYYPTPVHRLPFYASGESLPSTDWAAAHVLSLPVHPGVASGDIDQMCKTLLAS